jgi:hypothetical protein
LVRQAHHRDPFDDAQGHGDPFDLAQDHAEGKSKHEERSNHEQGRRTLRSNRLNALNCLNVLNLQSEVVNRCMERNVFS